MTDYKEMYNKLFENLTDITNQIVKIQKEAEILYIKSKIDEYVKERENNSDQEKDFFY